MNNDQQGRVRMVRVVAEWLGWRDIVAIPTITPSGLVGCSPGQTPARAPVPDYLHDSTAVADLERVIDQRGLRVEYTHELIRVLLAVSPAYPSLSLEHVPPETRCEAAVAMINRIGGHA